VRIFSSFFYTPSFSSFSAETETFFFVLLKLILESYFYFSFFLLSSPTTLHHVSRTQKNTTYEYFVAKREKLFKINSHRHVL